MSQSRVRAHGLASIPAQQAVDHANFMAKQEWLVIPSTTAPAWSSTLQFDFKDLNCLVHECLLEFNIGTLTGTGGITSIKLTPCQYWFDHIDILYMGNILKTIRPDDAFLRQQLFYTEEERVVMNCGSGLYSSSAQRVALGAQTPGARYYLYLPDIYNVAKSVPVLTPSHQVQVKVYMNALNTVASYTGTGTPSAPWIAANMRCRITRMEDPRAVTALRQDFVANGKLSWMYNELQYQPFVVNSGVSSTTLLLSGITGKVGLLLFVVRNLGYSAESYFAFNQVSQWALNNSSGQNIIGGNSINHADQFAVIAKQVAQSSYPVEATGIGTTSTSANVYFYTFSHSAVDQILDGVWTTHRQFTGNEQLVLTFPSTLGSNVEVAVYAYCKASLDIGLSSVAKTIH
jgi:hypothetical protein